MPGTGVVCTWQLCLDYLVRHQQQQQQQQTAKVVLAEQLDVDYIAFFASSHCVQSPWQGSSSRQLAAVPAQQSHVAYKRFNCMQSLFLESLAGQQQQAAEVALAQAAAREAVGERSQLEQMLTWLTGAHAEEAAMHRTFKAEVAMACFCSLLNSS